jgi:hypothetical protein
MGIRTFPHAYKFSISVYIEILAYPPRKVKWQESDISYIEISLVQGVLIPEFRGIDNREAQNTYKNLSP